MPVNHDCRRFGITLLVKKGDQYLALNTAWTNWGNAQRWWLYQIKEARVAARRNAGSRLVRRYFRKAKAKS